MGGFVFFFDLRSSVLLQIVEESCCSMYISSAINSYLLALIPKKSASLIFLDYGPIYLCNFV